MIRTFIYSDDKSNKFWSININGAEFTVTFGKVGTAGQSQTKSFADEAACQKEAEKLIREKTKKGYVEQGEGAAMPAAAPKAESKDTGLKIPKYKAPKDVELDELSFVVDITNPASIGSVIKHHLDNFEEYMEELPDGMLEYGTIVDDEFEPFEDGECSEEVFYKAAASFPELWPLLEKYAKKVIAACADETASGPWSSEETILGQFAIPALAMQDKKFVPLLLRYMASNVEIKFSNGFQQQFNDILAQVRAKYDMPAPGQKEPEDREASLLKKFLKNYKSDLAYAMTSDKPGYNNTNSLYSLQKKFGYHNSTDQVFKKLMGVIKEDMGSKKPMPIDKVIENAYHILDALQSRIPLARLTEIINNMAAGAPAPTTDVPNETHKWDFWELPNPVGDDGEGKSDIQTFAIRFESKDDLEKILHQFTDQFDQYLKVWRYSYYPDNFKIANLSAHPNSSGRYHNRESDFFLAVAKFPELAPLVTVYVEKITETNKTSLLLHAPSDNVKARGTYAAAAMALLDESTDEKLLAYLNTIPQEYLEARYGGVYRGIQWIWEKLGNRVPNLPKTFAAHPKLKG